MKKHRVGWIVGGAALIVLLVVAAIFSVPRFRAWRQHRSYEKKCAAFAAQNEKASKGQIVFIGDSITASCALDDYYNDLPLAVYNRGISGDTTAGLRKRLDVSLLEIQPAQVVIMIGTNDINRGVDLKTILKHYEEILDSIISSLPDTDVYVMSVIPQNSDVEKKLAVDVEVTTPKIISLNVALERLTHNYDRVVYVDLFSALEDENHWLRREYSDDGLHLNENGFAVWADVLKPYLAK